MNKAIACAAMLALLSVGTSVASAAGISAKPMTCNDGTEVYLESACEHRGGIKSVPIAEVKAKPIQASKPVASTSAAHTKKSNATANSKTTKKVATASSGPTAKCLDGAHYYSRERKGACAKHGGVDKWYGW